MSAAGSMEGDKSQSVIAAGVSSIAISLIFYSLRILSRLVSSTRIMWSDILLFGGVFACLAISSIDIYAVRIGFGRQNAYLATLDPELPQVVTILKMLMINNCFYAVGQVTVKISICLLYRQLFTSPRLHKLIHATIAYSIAWGITFVGISIFSCRPVHAFWDFTLQALPTTYCVNTRAWYIGLAVPNIITDVLVLCMPIKQIWALTLNKRLKWALIFIFALGIFVCVISIVRIIALDAIDNANPSYTLVGIANWSEVEFAIAVMCASLPTLRPLLRVLRPNSTDSQPAPGLQVTTIGGGHRFLRGSKKDPFERLHGLGSLENDTYAIHDVESLVEHKQNGSHTIKVQETVSVG